jgi:hypothetical protein
MLLNRFMAGALLFAMPVTPAFADYSRSSDRDCWNQDEATAARVQRFKTMLLVGALHCRQSQPYIMVDYNRFLSSQRAFINASAQVLRDRFERRFGAAYGLTAYSDYETALGNHMARADFTPGRCDEIADYARIAADVSEAGLVDLTYSTEEEDEPSACGPTNAMARDRWSDRPAAAVIATVAPPPPAPIPNAVAAEVVAALPPTPAPVAEPPAPPPAPVAVAGAEWPDLAPVEPESQPVAVEPNAAVVLAKAEPAPAVEATVQPAVAQTAAAQPDPTEALKAAIKSLNAAVEALEAARAPSTH